MDNMKLEDLSIREFLSKTASGSPVPGGGSIAALSAAIAASLSEMVAHLTIGKKGFEAKEEQMNDIVEAAAEYRNKLIKDIDRDADSYNDVLTAFRLPKGNKQEENNRKQAIVARIKCFFFSIFSRPTPSSILKNTAFASDSLKISGYSFKA